MRATIDVDAEWKVTIGVVDPDDQSRSWTEVRAMRRSGPVGNGRVVYPLPPGPVPGAWDAGDEAMIDAAYASIVRADPAREDMARFGAHLFHALIGGAAWSRILASATAHDPVIELALSWSRDDWHLHRLFWEMMYHEDRFLADPGAKLVAITRQVRGATAGAAPIVAPARVLFVVCVPLNDARIRPGAEVVGLLRQFRERKTRRGIQSRILVGADPGRGATPQELRQAARRFKPDVVHFVGHGRFDPVANQGVIEMSRGADEAADVPTGRTVDFLADQLRVDGALPAIVVVAACESGGVGTGLGSRPRLTPTSVAAPLAAEFVRAGVPIVVGMSGRVADMACRAFTRTFGLALVESKPLATATALGRAAAFVGAAAPARSVHWAFPVVFLSEAVPPGFTPIQYGPDDWAAAAERRIEAFKPRYDLVFCGREEFFADFDSLFEGETSVLGIYARQAGVGIGRTRLLDEFLGQAVRDGHVPCLYSFQSRNRLAIKGPNSIGEFALGLLEAIARTRNIFNLRPPIENALFDALSVNAEFQAFRDRATQRRGNPTVLFQQLLQEARPLARSTLGAGLVREALQADFQRLTRSARARHPRIADSKGRAILLLDNIDVLPRQVIDELISEVLGAEGSFGLGRWWDDRVPVAFTFTVTDDPSEREFWGGIMSHPAIRFREMTRFSKEENVLAHHRILLFPHEQPVPIWSGFSNVPWAVNDAIDDLGRSFGEQLFYVATDRGVPRMYLDPLFYESVALTRPRAPGETNYLMPAEEEKALEALVNHWKL
jgi:hypothetical protein